MRFSKHGEHLTRLYKVWKGLKTRCDNPNDPDWKDYKTFRAWALSHGYREDLELDRRDNNKDYSPSNCRFVTRQRNMQNTRLLRPDTHSGFRGVSRDGSAGKFLVSVVCKGRPLYRSHSFVEAKAAALHRDIHCIKNGLPLPLNFPELALQGPL